MLVGKKLDTLLPPHQSFQSQSTDLSVNQQLLFESLGVAEDPRLFLDVLNQVPFGYRHSLQVSTIKKSNRDSTSARSARVWSNFYLTGVNSECSGLWNCSSWLQIWMCNKWASTLTDQWSVQHHESCCIPDVPFLFPDRDEQPSILIRRKSAILPCGTEDRKQPTVMVGHPALRNSGLMFQTPVVSPPLHRATSSLTSREGGLSTKGASAPIIYHKMVRSCPIRRFTVYKCSNFSAQRPICLSMSDTRQPPDEKALSGAIIEGPVTILKIVNTEMTLDVITETADISLFVFPQETSIPRLQIHWAWLFASLTTRLFNIFQRLHRRKEIHPEILLEWPWNLRREKKKSVIKCKKLWTCHSGGSFIRCWISPVQLN